MAILAARVNDPIKVYPLKEDALPEDGTSPEDSRSLKVFLVKPGETRRAPVATSEVRQKVLGAMPDLLAPMHNLTFGQVIRYYDRRTQRHCFGLQPDSTTARRLAMRRQNTLKVLAACGLVLPEALLQPRSPHLTIADTPGTTPNTILRETERLFRQIGSLSCDLGAAQMPSPNPEQQTTA